MTNEEILQRCTTKLGMTLSDAQWVVENLYNYALPDFSEWSWRQIDDCFRDTLWFKGKTDVEVEAALLG